MARFVTAARTALASAALAVVLGTSANATGDRLFVGDGVDNNVKVFDAGSGAFLRSLPTSAAPVVGPRGIVLRSGDLFLVNQNVNQPFNGEILRFGAINGELRRAVVSGARPDAPFAPRGLILWRDHLFVANVCNPCLPPAQRGGDDRLNGPEGLVFGPDGRLYVTSFRGSARDTDKILIFEGLGGAHPGRRVGKIDLDAVGAGRSTAQALLFGPGGDLFVPINNVLLSDPVDTGAVRRYQIGCKPTATRKCFTNFVRPCDRLGASCKLGQGWYLSFGKTRPGTLAYGG